MRLLLLTFFSLCFLFVNAQPGKEANNWIFGQSRLDFSSGSAVPMPGFPGTYYESIATVSDENTGNLLFYTTGTTVLTSSANTMLNGTGLHGNISSTQCMIVPWPGKSGLYFIITPDQLAGSKGVKYSVVDMNQNNGLGKVTVKNKWLTLPPATEKVTAVRHCNGVDYWVFTHSYNSNTFNAYRVSSSGIDTIPVVSNVGVAHQFIAPGHDETTGQMKASPDGSKLAVAIWSNSTPLLEIFNVNNATGVVSNPIPILFPGCYGAYGLSFSPDNSKLYTCVYPGDTISALYQFDLSSGVPAQIIASKTLLAYRKWGISNKGYVGGMQMGPDRKIYIALYAIDTMAVIHDPNNTGLACNLQLDGLKLGPPWFAWCHFGLPNFIDANYAGIQINLPDIYQCNTFTNETLDAGGGYSNYQWSTGATTQTISITAPGNYWVTVTNTQGCQRTDTINAFVVQPFNIDTAVCDSFNADLTQAGAVQYNWYDSTSNPIKTLTQSGDYFVDVTFQNGCVLRDSVSVGVISSPKVELGPPVSLCDFKLELNAYYPGTSINWSTGATTSSITVNQPGTYWVTLQNSGGCTGRDTLVIGPPWQLVELLIPNIVTPNGDQINDEIDFAKFQFSAFTIRIYNRWGQMIFESYSPNAVWRPTGDDGTYFYTAEYKLDCGTYSSGKSIKGYITLIR